MLQGFEFNDAPPLPNQCFTVSPTHVAAVTQESGHPCSKGVLPSFKYTATEDAEVHFVDPDALLRVVVGAGKRPNDRT